MLGFWLRHTLGRPRDVVSIGKAIASIPPANRSERKIREAVRSEAKTIATAYFAEMAPHLDGFDSDMLLRLIDKNVLSPEDLKRISEAYADTWLEAFSEVALHTEHPFCALYKLGLLGYVGRDAETGEDVQIFRLPGEHPLDNVRVLPPARTYLVHPALDDLVAERNPKYFENLNDRNVIGRGRRWLRERVIRYVLQGDVKGHSVNMRDGLRTKAFTTVFDAIVAEFGSRLDLAERSQGNSLLLIDANPVKLLQAARNIQRDLARSEFGAQLRIAGDAGFVEIAAGASKRNRTAWPSRTRLGWNPMSVRTDIRHRRFRPSLRGRQGQAPALRLCPPRARRPQEPPLDGWSFRYRQGRRRRGDPHGNPSGRFSLTLRAALARGLLVPTPP